MAWSTATLEKHNHDRRQLIAMNIGNEQNFSFKLTFFLLLCGLSYIANCVCITSILFISPARDLPAAGEDGGEVTEAEVVWGGDALSAREVI